MTKTTSVKQAIEEFLSNVRKSHPTQNTYINYRSNLLGEFGFLRSLKGQIPPHSPIQDLNERHGVNYIQSMLDRGMSAATRRRAASCIRSFYGFVAYEYDLAINITKFSYALKFKQLIAGEEDVTNYPGEKIQRVLDFTLTLRPRTLEELRDLAFIWFLAETGLRVSEAVGLKIGQIDRKWQVSFIGKGQKSAVVKIGKRARKYISIYLKAREKMDSESGRPRSHLPIFIRHDENAGNGKIKQISQKRAQEIVHNMALLALGEEYDSSITCHKFRHYAITTVYLSKGDVRAAQEFGRHKDIRTTQRYTHRNSVDNVRISEEVFG